MPNELAIRLERIRHEAHLTFGDVHGAKWLNSPSRFFEGKSPIQFATELDKANSVLEHVSYYKGAEI